MLSKVSMSLFCNSTAEPSPLLTWQAKILPVLSVARVTTRSLPSRMMDPTLLHFRRRYRKKKKKKKKLGSGRSSDLLKQTEKPSQKGIQEEKRGKMNLQVLVEQIARTI